MRAVRTAGNRPVLMIYDGDHLDCTELRVKQDLFFVIVDLCAQKDTMEILARLNRCFPVAETEVEKGVGEELQGSRGAEEKQGKRQKAKVKRET